MPDDTLSGLEDARYGRLPRRRRSLSSGGAIFHLHARTGSRSKGQSARAAAAYIQRAGEYHRDQADELLYTESGHMPAWAAAEPTTYWDAADLHERANGRLFKRVEVALPLALTETEQRELAVGFAHHLTDGEDLPYTLAIHAGNGTNPHCHLLISERTNDGLERAPEQWFRRYNAAAPEQGGARKTEALKPKAWLEEARAALGGADQPRRWNGPAMTSGIDHRSLAAQGVERLPGVHLGPDRAGDGSARGRDRAGSRAEPAGAGERRAGARAGRAGGPGTRTRGGCWLRSPQAVGDGQGARGGVDVAGAGAPGFPLPQLLRRRRTCQNGAFLRRRRSRRGRAALRPGPRRPPWPAIHGWKSGFGRSKTRSSGRGRKRPWRRSGRKWPPSNRNGSSGRESGRGAGSGMIST